MVAGSVIDPTTGCPSDYAALFENYMPMIRSIVSKAGITAKDVDDVSMELLVKFMEKDALSWYDPTKLFDVGPNPRIAGPRMRPAKFQGLLRGFCRAWVRQHVDKQKLRGHREAKSLDATTASGTPWGEVYAEQQQDHLAAVEVGDALRAARRMCQDRMKAALREWSYQQAVIAEMEAASRKRLLVVARREVERKIEEAQRRERALVVAASLAVDGIRVTGSSVAKICGWSPAVGVSALRGAREDLRSVGL